MMGRYLYPGLVRRYAIKVSDGPLLVLDRSGRVPRPAYGPNTDRREFVSTAVVLIIGCYMAFSAGASNVPNAVAPLVSSGAIGEVNAIALATVAIGVGGFTIARRTMESVGTELSDIPLLAALIVMTTAATITTALSYAGIPISLVMAMVMTIVGLGWGRATRPVRVSDVVTGHTDAEISTGAITAKNGDTTNPIGQPESEAALNAGNLFNPRAILKYVSMWIIGPSVALLLSYGFFVFVPFVG
jgi:PiT family inorganic phosphate transporter